MYRWIMCLCILLGSGIAQAHQPDLSSTILSDQGENKWVLQVRAALTAFEFEIHHHYGKDSYATPEEFQDLLINYVQENISILFDDVNVAELHNGRARLGHETNVVFEVEGIPEIISEMKFKNNSFKDISRNKSALIVLKNGFTKRQFELNNENQHTAHLKVKDAQFIALISNTKKTMAMSIPFVGFVFLGIAGLSMLFIFRNRKAEV